VAEAKKLDSLTDEQLVAENQRLVREKDRIRDRQFKVKAILDERDAQHRAEALLEGLNDVQIQAVAAAAKAAKA
jgi:hypothetical protein